MTDSLLIAVHAFACHVLMAVSVDNGFPNYIVDIKIIHFINKTEPLIIDNTLISKHSLNIFYKNSFIIIII